MSGSSQNSSCGNSVESTQILCDKCNRVIFGIELENNKRGSFDRPTKSIFPSVLPPNGEATCLCAPPPPPPQSTVAEVPPPQVSLIKSALPTLPEQQQIQAPPIVIDLTQSDGEEKDSSAGASKVIDLTQSDGEENDSEATNNDPLGPDAITMTKIVEVFYEVED
ncbi:hypothetical protein GH714_005108 [Hevea brasiliensis]|uniref:Uncharacterized protein n=1 Tax=Hevea brasiliensis TaxID=3981 RepID=A0A6A6KAS3_HEVBR|nr:hypothetical protein GH714_004798 [Hevea brasiliensis]KAF2285492.1 hypothetical protein GH714_005002 [Hevea brasiliensis]KAF2285494.1 hypothetical protein GH714_005013 [Hevea brasiliensis]KAF2285497.1 hypothetical protein GH714_005068 [Hevea brasiliensis]KAF2285500.1 hypothetical protein GH714_005092 [Hevea brasiliensis]